MDSSTFSPPKPKLPDLLDFILPEKPNLFRDRMSVSANITQNPEDIHFNVSLTKQKKSMIRDSPLEFLNGTKVLSSIVCSKYAKNFGIMCDVTLLPPSNRMLQHNLQLEMSTTGPLLRYGLTINKDLSDVLENSSAQLCASASYGFNKPSAAFGAHLWAPFPFVDTFRSHAFVNCGTAPNSLSGMAGVGISTKIGERGRIDLNYCFVTGFQVGIGFNYEWVFVTSHSQRILYSTEGNEELFSQINHQITVFYAILLLVHVC